MITRFFSVPKLMGARGRRARASVLIEFWTPNTIFCMWKENGLWKAGQAGKTLMMKLLLKNSKRPMGRRGGEIWNVHYSWQIFALADCWFLIFLHFMPSSHSIFLFYGPGATMSVDLPRIPSRLWVRSCLFMGIFFSDLFFSFLFSGSCMFD